MGHGLFIVLHIVALVFGMLLLVVTIPLHLIYAALSTRRTSSPTATAEDAPPSAATHVRCPDCRELVRMDARKCKHCGADLVPQAPPTPPKANSPAEDRLLLIITLGIAGLIFLLAMVATAR
jgi:hypothetical protein